jgi:hypothetical protein
MKEKLAQLNNRPFQIDIYKGQIKKVEDMIFNAPKRKKEELEQKLQDLNNQLSILKKRKY